MWLFKFVATNGDIEQVITNDFYSTITAHVVQEANDVRGDQTAGLLVSCMALLERESGRTSENAVSGAS